MPVIILAACILGLWVYSLSNVAPKPYLPETFSDWTLRYWNVIGVALFTALVMGVAAGTLVYDRRRPQTCVKSHVVKHDATECVKIPLFYEKCEPVHTEETVCDEWSSK
jgi:hypothetical protein